MGVSLNGKVAGSSPAAGGSIPSTPIILRYENIYKDI